MVPLSPVAALGSHASGVRELVAEVVRSRHDHAAEAHQAAATRYGMGFGTQWRDLLDDTHEALRDRGFRSHKLTPGGHKLPIVNDCLVYVWRVPEIADTVSKFASSPTRRNGFHAPPPDPVLFEPSFADEGEPADDAPESELERVARMVGDVMPLVLVMVHSSPRQLQSIEWAVAEFHEATGDIKLHGQECIWRPEIKVDDATANVESFDSGTPVAPTVELQKKEGPQSDA